jgi:lipoate-protein ligase A
VNALQWRRLDVSYDSAFKNLALEEALARTASSTGFLPTVRFWTNVPTVVLGRFQEASSEVDLDLCESSGVPIVRRFTGGGAVFHDKGTLNITIVTNSALGLRVKELHEKYGHFLMESLENTGLDCSFSPPNSILVDGKKLCGAAAALGTGYAVWHASILVTTDIALLESVLAPSKISVPTRFVRSNWKPVTTIAAALDGTTDVEKIRSLLAQSFKTRYDSKLASGRLSDDEEKSLRALLPKYSSDRWNFNGNRSWAGSKEGVE